MAETDRKYRTISRERQLSLIHERNNPFPKVFAAIEAGERVRAGLNAIEDVLAVCELSCPNPACQLGDRILKFVHMVEDHKALHSGPPDQEVPFDPWPNRPILPVGDRCRSADNDPRADRQVPVGRIADRTRDIIKVYIGPVWT